jgi:very-short-patch-repair endonuclease
LEYKIGNDLRYDFYLPDYKIIIEFDGEQHFKFSAKFHQTEESFQERKYIDIIKTFHVLTNNLRMIRIDHE